MASFHSKHFRNVGADEQDTSSPLFAFSIYDSGLASGTSYQSGYFQNFSSFVVPATAPSPETGVR